LEGTCPCFKKKGARGEEKKNYRRQNRMTRAAGIMATGVGSFIKHASIKPNAMGGEFDAPICLSIPTHDGTRVVLIGRWKRSVIYVERAGLMINGFRSHYIGVTKLT
jgi:hypothetical protein